MIGLRTLSRAALALAGALSVSLACGPAFAQEDTKTSPAPHTTKQPPQKQTTQAKQPTPDEQLQQTINDAGNDRAALVRNLEDFLKTYPEARQRPQIYRALVEASLQLRDTLRAADYAERFIALAPDDMSITLLAIQLLERAGDEAAVRRAVSYATRVLGYVDRISPGEKSPRVSQEAWETEKKRDHMSVLLLRGRLYMKLHDTPSAQKDFAASYALLPAAPAAEKLGEIAELNKDLNGAIKYYARAFALSDAAGGGANRHELRQKLGNVWRLAHGSEDGLGEYLLHTYDEVASAAGAAKTKRNADAKDPYQFTLRKAPEGLPFSLGDARGKILVMNFWATWCGPCRAIEPHFEHVAAQFQEAHDVVFLAMNCDEDETLVPPYLGEEKLKTPVLYADGLDRLLEVNSFPTIIILDRSGKIAYRAEGFDPDTVEKDLTEAINRAITVAKVASAVANSNP